jgi:hypothetical protein
MSGVLANVKGHIMASYRVARTVANLLIQRRHFPLSEEYDRQTALKCIQGRYHMCRLTIYNVLVTVNVTGLCRTWRPMHCDHFLMYCESHFISNYSLFIHRALWQIPADTQ